MYTELHDINTPDPAFNAWASSVDAWLDTPDGSRWLADQCEAFEMASAAEHYGTRPGLENRHAHR